MTNSLQTLLEKKELATLNMVGVVIHAIGSLNMNDPAQALHTLMVGLDLYLRADNAITEFRKLQTQKKENYSDGNASNQSAA